MATLFRNHFQIAYVARETEAAQQRLGDRYGVSKWHVMDLHRDDPNAATRYISTAYAGEVMLELIEPRPGSSSIYDNWLAAGQSLKLHHLGFYAYNDEEMRAGRAQLVANGLAIPAEGRFGDLLEFLYADCVAELGHYYELVHLLPAGRDFFAPTPRN